MCMDELSHRSDEVTRRSFLTGAAKSFLGLGLLPIFSRLGMAQDQGGAPVLLRPATARNVIYLYMSGGMSHLDTFDTKPGAETQGPVESLRTSADGVQVSQYFPLLAKQMDKVAVINSMQSTQGAHVQGRYFMHTSYVMRGTITHPSMGAWTLKLRGPENPAVPAHVVVGRQQYTAGPGFFDSSVAPLPVDDPSSGLANARAPQGVTDERRAKRLDRLAKMNEAFHAKHGSADVAAHAEVYDQALELMRSRDLAAFDTTQEPDALRDAYGRDRFGQGCLLARRLVEHGVRFVEVVSNGWDTHNENFDQLEDKCPELDRGLAALLADLESRGLLEETLVVVATEFGRTPQITEGRNGRDHFPKAFTCLLAGGGIKGGLRWGKTDARGENVIDSPVTVPDFNATIAHALGLPLDHILYSPSGRPFTAADKGKPVLGLFA